MKSFLKTVLAVLFGLFLAGFLFIFLITGIIGAMTEDELIYVNPHSVLVIDLSRMVPTRSITTLGNG